jgi:hypothetical protein
VPAVFCGDEGEDVPPVFCGDESERLCRRAAVGDESAGRLLYSRFGRRLLWATNRRRAAVGSIRPAASVGDESAAGCCGRRIGGGLLYSRFGRRLLWATNRAWPAVGSILPAAPVGDESAAAVAESADGAYESAAAPVGDEQTNTKTKNWGSAGWTRRVENGGGSTPWGMDFAFLSPCAVLQLRPYTFCFLHDGQPTQLL